MKSFLLACAAMILCNLPLANATAAGLDVQLKDIKRSFYFIKESPKECQKLTRFEVKELGPLTHCHSDEDRVECPTKSGKTVVAYEEKTKCDGAAKAAMEATAQPPPHR